MVSHPILRLFLKVTITDFQSSVFLVVRYSFSVFTPLVDFKAMMNFQCLAAIAF
jgi:hypothetical protein